MILYSCRPYLQPISDLPVSHVRALYLGCAQASARDCFSSPKRRRHHRCEPAVVADGTLHSQAQVCELWTAKMKARIARRDSRPVSQPYVSWQTNPSNNDKTLYPWHYCELASNESRKRMPSLIPRSNRTYILVK